MIEIEQIVKARQKVSVCYSIMSRAIQLDLFYPIANEKYLEIANAKERLINSIEEYTKLLAIYKRQQNAMHINTEEKRK